MAIDDSFEMTNGKTKFGSTGKLVNGNGIHQNNINKHNNNGIIPNGKTLEVSSVEKGSHLLSMSEKPNNYDSHYLDSEVTFGWGPFKPKRLQCLATKQMFLVVFCITWVLQGMYFTYFVSVITTIEKLFQIQSKTTGIIMSATEIGQIGSSLLLTYYGGQGHRPKWIAWGMVLFAISSFTCSMPHFIFGEQLIDQNKLLLNTGSVSSEVNGMNVSVPIPVSLCKYVDKTDRNLTEGWANSLSGPITRRTDSAEYCEGEFLAEQRIQGKITTVVLAIFFASLLGVGMGQTAVYTLGIPYIDDNVAGRESPLYFAITIGVRILGPALGFILGSFCTMIYVDLSADPPITPADPRWIGAWWLGLVLISALLILVSIAMFAFPSRLPNSRMPPVLVGAEKPSLKDFPKSIKRLLKNEILMLRTASSVLHILPIAGLYTFLPKYLESQFRLPAHYANMISGVGGILVMGIGIIVSGVYILTMKPNPRFVAGWISFTAVVYAIGMAVLMFVGCPMNDFTGLVNADDGVSSFQPTCDPACDCDQNKFSPICGADGRTYFSACHAGCSNYSIIDGKLSSFSDCQCISGNSTIEDISGTAKAGYCPLDCNNFWIYMTLFSIFVFMHSTSEVGSMLLIMRCVDPRDKAMALGLIQFAIGLFGNVPCPIIYGAVVDSACLVWEYSCGERGACWLYDSNVFRMFFHGMTAFLMGLAYLVDVVVWYKAGSISFHDEQEGEKGTAEEMANLKNQEVQATDNDYL